MATRNHFSRKNNIQSVEDLRHASSMALRWVVKVMGRRRKRLRRVDLRSKETAQQVAELTIQVDTLTQQTTKYLMELADLRLRVQDLEAQVQVTP